jgi:hypothetical protein
MYTQLRPFSGTLLMVSVSIVWPTEPSCVCMRGASEVTVTVSVVEPGFKVITTLSRC